MVYRRCLLQQQLSLWLSDRIPQVTNASNLLTYTLSTETFHTHQKDNTTPESWT